MVCPWAVDDSVLIMTLAHGAIAELLDPPAAMSAVLHSLPVVGGLHCAPCMTKRNGSSPRQNALLGGTITC